MLHVILITTYNRMHLLHRCIESLERTVPDDPIFVVNDGSNGYGDTQDYLLDAPVECVIDRRHNAGIAPSINTGLVAIHDWCRFRRAEGLLTEEVWVSYVQDDVEFIERNWPTALMEYRNLVKRRHTKHRLGFLTGHSAPEHENSTVERINGHIQLRKHIRATHMMTRLDKWMSHLPISELGERGNPRGRPGGPVVPGCGSDVDWWFLRGHNKSVLAEGRVNLVAPGILKHAGQSNSTWQPGKVHPEDL